MNTNRTTVFIICLFYLVGLFFLLGAMSETITGIDTKSTSQTINPSINFLGFELTVGDTFLGNVIMSIDTIPLWVNTIFILIPFALMVLFGIMMWIPTIPSG